VYASTRIASGRIARMSDGPSKAGTSSRARPGSRCTSSPFSPDHTSWVDQWQPASSIAVSACRVVRRSTRSTRSGSSIRSGAPGAPARHDPQRHAGLTSFCRIRVQGHTGWAIRTDCPRRHGTGVLPSAIPSDSGQRRVVGPRLHRVDHWHRRATPLCRPLATARTWRSWLLRPPRTGGRRGSRGPRPHARRFWFRPLPLLVPRSPATPSTLRRGSRLRYTGPPVRRVLGQREGAGSHQGSDRDDTTVEIEARANGADVVPSGPRRRDSGAEPPGRP